MPASSETKRNTLANERPVAKAGLALIIREPVWGVNNRVESIMGMGSGEE